MKPQEIYSIVTVPMLFSIPYTETVVAHMSPNHGTPTPTLEVAWVSHEKFKVKMRGTEVLAAF